MSFLLKRIPDKLRVQRLLRLTLRLTLLTLRCDFLAVGDLHVEAQLPDGLGREAAHVAAYGRLAHLQRNETTARLDPSVELTQWSALIYSFAHLAAVHCEEVSLQPGVGVALLVAVARAEETGHLPTWDLSLGWGPLGLDLAKSRGGLANWRRRPSSLDLGTLLLQLRGPGLYGHTVLVPGVRQHGEL